MPTRTRGKVLAGGALVLLLAGGIVFLLWDRFAIGALNAERRAALAMGEAVYQSACASCHGVELEGQPDWRRPGSDGKMPAPPHDATGHTWHHSDDVLFNLTKFGLQAYVSESYQSDMPAFADVLSDDEMWAVINYIKSTWPEEIRRSQASRNNQT